MILKIVQIAVFSAPCFGVCAQFVRGARRCAKKGGRAVSARPEGSRLAHTRRGRGGNTAAANPNQSLLLKEKAGEWDGPVAFLFAFSPRRRPGCASDARCAASPAADVSRDAAKRLRALHVPLAGAGDVVDREDTRELAALGYRQPAHLRGAHGGHRGAHVGIGLDRHGVARHDAAHGRSLRIIAGGNTAHDDVAVKITTKIPESGWSYDEGKKCLVENDDPTAFGAGAIRFEVRANVEDFDYYKDDFENYQDIDDRVIGGITFKGRTYKRIGYDWIEYVAQIDDGRALSIGLRKLDCVPGTMPDVILSGMTIK